MIFVLLIVIIKCCIQIEENRARRIEPKTSTMRQMRPATGLVPYWCLFCISTCCNIYVLYLYFALYETM
jgi:hypothetical protein